MPLRIYDISKNLGIDNKAVLAKAKALGIAAAKVPSSSLDRLSAEYLEEELLKDLGMSLMSEEVWRRARADYCLASQSFNGGPDCVTEIIGQG